MNRTPLTELSQEIPYTPDAAGLFDALGGREGSDTVLLESADVSTRSGVESLLVLSASVRLTCSGTRVLAEPLTDSGRALVAYLEDELAGFVDRSAGEGTGAVFSFPRPSAGDERERLVEPSPVLTLRALATLPGAPEDLPLIAGGFAFDFVASFEDLPEVAAGENTFPDFQFLVAETVAEVGHRENTARLRALAAGGDAGRLEERLEGLAARAREAAEPQPPAAAAGAASPGGSEPVVARASVGDEEFRGTVDRVREAIAAGEIYQAVPSRSFAIDCPDAFAAYRELRAANPSPYMFYLRGLAPGGPDELAPDEPFELFGASPESAMKFTAEDRSVEVYPIAGTRPRGRDADGSIDHERDIRNELELRTDNKELAEHVMLVDLARNDIARVAEPGTRRVAQLLQVDRYSRVMHLVSRVVGRLSSDMDALDAYRACMNMGTLTGAPKLRAAELLRELEGARRGSYGGAVGYLRGGGDFDTCIVIRSGFVQGGRAVVQAGAGVVRDSRPQAEADETAQKADAVLAAIASSQGRRLEVAR